MKQFALAILTVVLVVISSVSVQAAPKSPARATAPSAARFASGGTSAATATRAPTIAPAPTATLALAVTPAPVASPPRPASGDELPQLSFVVAVLALLTTILAIISGYTLYRSHREAGEAKRAASDTLSDARSALVEARATLEACADTRVKVKAAQETILVEWNEMKASLEKRLKEDKAAFTQRMESELESFRRQLHEATTINRTKGQLMQLLSGDAPKPEDIFPLLTDIINYPDQRSIEIFERLLEVFAEDKQIVAKVRLGLQTFRERFYLGALVKQ